MIPSTRVTLKTVLFAATILAVPLLAAAPALAQVTIGISVQTEPPMLPVYSQPPIPEPGYIWTPGFWAWSAPVGYYWVPGTWVLPPMVGMLWTPPYWGWSQGVYVFHEGYWGPHVGFYGGINYGFGYGGTGYDGGRWEGNIFAYNRRANNLGSVRYGNVYERTLTTIGNSHVSYLGGARGARAQPSVGERAAEREHHTTLTQEQTRHVGMAENHPDLAASRNAGRPGIPATSRPAQFEMPGAGRPIVPGPAPRGDTHSVVPGLVTPGHGPAHEAPAQRPAPQPTERAAPPPVQGGPARVMDGRPGGPSPVPAHEAPAQRPAPQPAEHAAPQPAQGGPARVMDGHPGGAGPAPAHEAPAQRPAPQPAERAAPPPSQGGQHQGGPNRAGEHEATGEQGKERRQER